MKTNLILTSFFLFFLFMASAQENKETAQTDIATNVEDSPEFKISAEIRPRLEYYHGYKSLAQPDQDHGLSISQRNRLNLDFKNSNFIVKLSLQDVRIWGNQEQLVANEDFSASIHEAWGEAIITPAFSVKLGRQEIIYDDHRIFGSVNWAQQARSHDAAILKLKTGNFNGELALAYNQDGVNLTGTDNVARPSNYKAFQNLWINYKFTEDFNASLLILNNGTQIDGGGDAYSQTIGSRITFDNKTFAAHGAFYFQGGETSTTQTINANYFSLDASYKINDMFSAGLGFERLSGNDQLDNNNENNAFTPFYGTNHKFNGHMDYFYVGNHVGSVGLQDIFIQLNAKLPKFNLGLHTHLFSVAGELADPVNPTEALDKNLGTELDMFFSFNLTKGVIFKGGYSHMFGTETMEVLKGSVANSKDETSNWAYAMVIFKPTLFKNTK